MRRSLHQIGFGVLLSWPFVVAAILYSCIQWDVGPSYEVVMLLLVSNLLAAISWMSWISARVPESWSDWLAGVAMFFGAWAIVLAEASVAFLCLGIALWIQYRGFVWPVWHEWP